VFSYFVFNGVNSRDMGVYLANPAPIMRGKERVTEQTVLGLAGTLTLPDGEDNYEPYVQQLVLRAREPISEISKWLRGDGYVTFSGEPDRKQKARVINQTQFKKISRHLTYWEGTVQFRCQPLKEALHEAEYAVSNGAAITNLGDVTERPVFTFTGAYGNFTVSAGGKTLAITGLDQDLGGCVIDCGAGYVLSYDKTQLITNLSGGEFPELKPGQNTLTLTGSHLGTVTIGRRQRWL
jgi:phage-related protein